jgi:hypothetical protein
VREPREDLYRAGNGSLEEMVTCKREEPVSWISAPICFSRIFYPFLDRFFHLLHTDFNGKHLSYLNKTNWPGRERRGGVV